MKVKAIAEMKLRIEEIDECTPEEYEVGKEKLQNIPIDEFEEELADSLCVDSAKVSSLEFKTEIIEE